MSMEAGARELKDVFDNLPPGHQKPDPGQGRGYVLLLFKVGDGFL